MSSADSDLEAVQTPKNSQNWSRQSFSIKDPLKSHGLAGTVFPGPETARACMAFPVKCRPDAAACLQAYPISSSPLYSCKTSGVATRLLVAQKKPSPRTHCSEVWRRRPSRLPETCAGELRWGLAQNCAARYSPVPIKPIMSPWARGYIRGSLAERPQLTLVDDALMVFVRAFDSIFELATIFCRHSLSDYVRLTRCVSSWRRQVNDRLSDLPAALIPRAGPKCHGRALSRAESAAWPYKSWAVPAA
jgi:hypothetical protein